MFGGEVLGVLGDVIVRRENGDVYVIEGCLIMCVMLKIEGLERFYGPITLIISEVRTAK